MYVCMYVCMYVYLIYKMTLLFHLMLVILLLSFAAISLKPLILFDRILTPRLQHWLVISSTVLILSFSFLADRSQTIIIPAFKSQPILLEYGVPQGSVL